MPAKELLAALWDFVHGRSSIRQFEEFVCEERERLGTLLSEENVNWLTELDYGKTHVARLRADLGKAITPIEMECACLRFPSSSTGDGSHVFLPPLVHSAFALVEHHIETSLALIAKDRWYAQQWQSSIDGVLGVAVQLQDGCFYCCRTCSRSFLIVLDETNLDYLVLSVSARELTESTPQQLRERFAADFGYVPVPPQDIN